jgi:RNA polymerase sporulation-specific sigma factor
MRVSRSIRDTAYKVLKTRNELERLDEEATAEKIACALEIPTSEVVYALDAISDTVSIYDPVYSKEGEELLLVDQIKDDKESDERWTENIALRKATVKLDERERRIIFMRYYESVTKFVKKDVKMLVTTGMLMVAFVSLLVISCFNEENSVKKL